MSEETHSHQEQKLKDAALLSSMVQSTFDFWQTVLQEMMGPHVQGDDPASRGQGSQRPSPLSSMQETFETLQSAMVDSGLMDGMAQGLNTFPEVSMKMAQAWTENMSSLFKESMSGMENSLSGYSQHRPESSLQALAEAYSQSMQKMLNMPKLGMNRTYQERMAQAMDKLNTLTAVASEFSLQMLQPVESSLGKMQQKLKDMGEGDGYVEDAKEYYSMWIKLLEGDYMNLLQSPEFVSSFHKVVNTYFEFYAVYEEVMQDGLQFVPVTTKKDMNAVYRENHLMKKEVRAMSRRMEELEKKVEQLKSSTKT